jgi:hypothetical protein
VQSLSVIVILLYISVSLYRSCSWDRLGWDSPWDEEEYRSMACVLRDVRDGRCYDFRAYKAYGNGLRCSASGSITKRLGKDVEIVQRDGDMAQCRTSGAAAPLGLRAWTGNGCQGGAFAP